LKLNSKDLDTIADLTLDHYNERTEYFLVPTQRGQRSDDREQSGYRASARSWTALERPSVGKSLMGINPPKAKWPIQIVARG
jgi:hypothetical protein